MPTITLAENLHVEVVNPVEAQLVYREIFELQTYDQYGINLAAGDCVFDVGANIGLYTIHLTRSYPDLKVFAFEPIPALFTILEHNVATYAPGAKLFPIGLGAQIGNATFDYNRYSTITSSMRPSDFAGAAERDAKWWQWFRAGIADLRKIRRFPSWLALLITGWLSLPILRWAAFVPFAIYVLAVTIRNRLATQHIYRPIATLSEIVREYQLEHIHLLKIDVEGGEADVIAGIEPRDWDKISQLVIEVHNVNGRVDELRDLLEGYHYHVHIAQEDWALHRLLGIFTVYATRTET